MLANRYRIVGLLGRGGMGEVYRADDVKLGQPVALKFLPAALAGDAQRLRLFLSEVRIARQVSHPHVCRVYDVGEAAGHHYLSMEYVDGEDLATLLRRIGRLPEDKALEIARQLCAGLAAAHEQGVLHRDLKPANVMLDGRGRAKLTDFGLAGLAEAPPGDEIRAGTPAYMAPEQRAGKEVSVRSDIYSLGLVLHELFTGRRASDAGSTAGTSHLDPAVERALRQCLEAEPGERPSSALAVAAALPGGDPLAAALAAGETPSPEMVAAAGPRGGLRPGVANACLASVVVLWLAGWYPSRALNPYAHLPFVKSYEALKENARGIADRLGYGEPANHAWAGFGFDLAEYFHLVREHGPLSLVEHLAQPGQAVLGMQYRQAEAPITPARLDGRVDWTTPAPVAGEVAIEIDLQGRLTGLRVTPTRRPTGRRETQVDWSTLFEVAGLELGRFEAATPTLWPPSFADERRAWTGVLPDAADRPVRIEAAALDGRPVYLVEILSSSPEWAAQGDTQPRAGTGVFVAVTVVLAAFGALVVGGALFVAVRNLRLGRGDRQGAHRMAAFVFAMRALHWALGGDHVGHPDELRPLVVALGGAATLALLAWVVYVACEPYLRRLWPRGLIAWSRVLAGRFADPLVGRDILIGCTASSIQGFVLVLAYWIAARAHLVGVLPLQNPLVLLRGGRYAVGQLFSTALFSVAAALAVMVAFLLFRMLCRRTWIAGTVFCLFWGSLAALQFAGLFGAKAGLFGLLFQAFNMAAFVIVLVRFGLLALVASWGFGSLGALLVFTFDPSAPYFGLGLFVSGVAFAIAGYGWWVALAGRPLPRNTPLES